MTDTAPTQKNALIIGAGPGLGAALARRFGREGFALTLIARNEQNLAATADDLRGDGLTVDTVTADTADAGAFRSALETLAERVTPSVVIYNAAALVQDSILTSDTDYLLSAFTVDVLGAVTTAQVFTPAMRAAGEGTFLVTGGGLSLYPHAEYASLSIGKAALRSVTSLLHDELKDAGVHAAGVTVAGAIEPGTALAPELIADAYWQLHSQPTGEWAVETIFDGR
jgi:short-subunit dehydrogenase